MSEGILVNEIIRYYYESNLTLDRINAGKFKVGKRWITTCKKGTPDLVGYIAPNGQHVGIECKSKGGKQSPEQIDYEKDCLAKGAVYILAYSLSDVIAVLGEPVR